MSNNRAPDTASKTTSNNGSHWHNHVLLVGGFGDLSIPVTEYRLKFYCWVIRPVTLIHHGAGHGVLMTHYGYA